MRVMAVRLISTATRRNTIGKARPMDSIEFRSDLSDENVPAEERVFTYQRAAGMSASIFDSWLSSSA